MNEIIAQISFVNKESAARAKYRFDNLIKPFGSLSNLEETVIRYSAVLGKYRKQDIILPKRSLLIWSDAGHFAEAEKIINGDQSVNVLAEETGAAVEVLMITASSERSSTEEGAALVKEYVKKGDLMLLGYGCLSDAGNDLIISAMAGGILQAAALKVPVVVDGIATIKAVLKAAEMAPQVIDYCFASQITLEPEMENLVKKLGLSAPLRLNIKDGCGMGAVVEFILFDAAIKVYREMETFEEAGVHVEIKDFSHVEQMKHRR
ncbi:MAG: nicotinate-nucleotide--dimethylbenzimidazole phosphoribosyltransferase [Phascolarctobacterium sp.]|nr:nicotinate-nucleotide--dimethylbenzimidazole phosphoribosyltransferase [Phascolarctobacterium sp.]